MGFLGDYHTHTIYSRKPFVPYNHAKGTIEDNIIAAKQMGLSELAISDHGFSHKFYGCSRKKLKDTKAEIQRLASKHDMKVYCSVEANFVSEDGTIDVISGDMDYLDIVLCGFHQMAKPKTVRDTFKIFWANFFAGIFGTSKALKNRNTNMIVNAIRNNNIDVITHLGCKMDCDVEPIVKEAVKKGTLIELNEKHCDFTKEDVDLMLSLGANFVVDSDAHKPEKIGKFKKVEDLIERYNIPKDRIMNWDKVPEFLNQKLRNKKSD